MKNADICSCKQDMNSLENSKCELNVTTISKDKVNSSCSLSPSDRKNLDEWRQQFIKLGSIFKEQLDLLDAKCEVNHDNCSLPSQEVHLAVTKQEFANYDNSYQLAASKEKISPTLESEFSTCYPSFAPAANLVGLRDPNSSDRSLEKLSSASANSDVGSSKSEADTGFPDDASCSLSDNLSCCKGCCDGSRCGTVSPPNRSVVQIPPNDGELGKSVEEERGKSARAEFRRSASVAASPTDQRTSSALPADPSFSAIPAMSRKTCSEPQLAYASDRMNSADGKENNLHYAISNGRLPFNIPLIKSENTFSDRQAFQTFIKMITFLNDCKALSSSSNDKSVADSLDDEEDSGTDSDWILNNTLNDESALWTKVVATCGEVAQLERRKLMNDHSFERLGVLRKTTGAHFTPDSATRSKLCSDGAVNQSPAIHEKPNGILRPLNNDATFQKRRTKSFRVYSKPVVAPLPLSSLSFSHMKYFRKWAICRLSSLIEKYWPCNNKGGKKWDLNRILRRIRHPDYRNHSVFGIPLNIVMSRTGKPLPPPILWALHFLSTKCLDQRGIFRRPGSKLRIQQLRAAWEMADWIPDLPDEMEAYDVADLLKQYLRSIPGGLLTEKFTDTFLALFSYVPDEQKSEAVQTLLFLLPDENREALHSLLYGLSKIAESSGKNQMTVHNLSICVSPSLFLTQSSGRNRRRTVASPDATDLATNRCAVSCLSYLISEQQSLFQIPFSVESVHVDVKQSLHWNSMDKNGWKKILSDHVSGQLDNVGRRWVRRTCSNAELSYRETDGLRIWQACVDVEAPPAETVARFMYEKTMFDPNVIAMRRFPLRLEDGLGDNGEIFQFVVSSTLAEPPREYCLLRHLQSLARGYMLTESSIDYPDVCAPSFAVRGLMLGSRLTVEECGEGRCRVVHTCRVDTRGRGSRWDSSVLGEIIALNLNRLRQSFALNVDGPESRV